MITVYFSSCFSENLENARIHFYVNTSKLQLLFYSKGWQEDIKRDAESSLAGEDKHVYQGSLMRCPLFRGADRISGCGPCEQGPTCSVCPRTLVTKYRVLDKHSVLTAVTELKGKVGRVDYGGSE